MARQLDLLRSGLAQQYGLPFADLMPDDTAHLLGTGDDPVYAPLVTLWMFLSQVLDPIGSCQQAVARLIVGLTAQGREPCSANTGARG